MGISLVPPPTTLVYIVPFLVAAYYLGVRRSVAGPAGNNRTVTGFLKVLLLVCLTCIAVAALVVAAGNPANHHWDPVSFAYMRTAKLDNGATLRQLEADFMKAAAERGSQGYMSYYADDAVELPNGGPVIQGKLNIAKSMGFLDDKNNRLTWAPVAVDISGNLGYTYGTYEFRSIGKDGNPVVDRGKYASIWKKQMDGRWKVALDIGNSGGAEPPQ
jgi:ketosteroid isomerase-like protein